MAYNEDLKYDKFTEKTLVKFTYKENNFNIIPPIIGILFADLFGNAIMTFEYGKNDRYKPIKSYLLDDNSKNILEIDLISMYFSAFSSFASNTNIKNLSRLEIHGSNLKIQISFLFDKFMIICFLNSNILLSLKLQEQILEYFSDLIKIHESKLINFNSEESKDTLRKLRNKGKSWLKRLNKNYIQNFEKGYLMKFDYIENFIEEVDPIIKNEINEYLNVPDDIMNDLSREIKNKIQDKIFELVTKLFKKVP